MADLLDRLKASLADRYRLERELGAGGNLAWYRLPAAGGPAVRLGNVPRYPANCFFAADGRRVLALVENFHSDVYLVPGFAEVLKR